MRWHGRRRRQIAWSGDENPGGVLVWDDVRIDQFVMAITAAEATVRHTTSIERLVPQRVWRGDMLCTWLCICTFCAGILAGGLVVLLAARMPADKHTAL
jgi:hypothetical protein